MQEEIIKMILDEAFYVHKAIGPGMLEAVYKMPGISLKKRSLSVEIEKPIPVIFEEVKNGLWTQVSRYCCRKLSRC